jgi:hypothetical protein
MVSTYVYYFVFLAVSFLVFCLEGGAFPGVDFNIGRGMGDYIFINSPSSILEVFSGFIVFATLVIAAVFGSSAARDFENGMFALYFTKPVRKSDYVLGRFFGSAVSVLIILSSISLGIFLATLMPFLQTRNLGPNQLLAYIQPYYLMVIPDLIFMGLLFYGVTLFSRRVMSAYIVAIGLFLGYMLASILMGDVVDNRYTCLLDPFGMLPLDFDTRYWSTVESNTRFMPLGGMLLLNRLIWLGLGLLGWAMALRKFSFGWEQDTLLPHRVRNRKTRTVESTSLPNRANLTVFHLRPYDTWRQTFSLTRTEIRHLKYSPGVWVISMLFLLFLFGAASQVGRYSGTNTYPLTSKILEVLERNLFLFGLIISTFYAGDLLWRSRTLKMDQLLDVTPHRPLADYLSKLLTVIYMQLIILAMIIITGVSVQIFHGYYRLELGQYMFQLLAISFPTMLITTLAAFFFAIVIPNKYAGYLAMIAFYVIFWLAPQVNVDHRLLLFNSGASMTYSEMNGFGASLPWFFCMKTYWGLFALALTMVGLKLWPRGVENSFLQRLRRARTDGFDRHWQWTAGMLAGFILLGGFIFHNTNILNQYHTNRYRENALVRYEKDYKRYEKLSQPRITAVDLRVELYPSRRGMATTGYYWMVNRGSAPIDSILVDCNTDTHTTRLELSRPAGIVFDGKEFGLRLYRLGTPLVPGDSLRLDFSLVFDKKGFPNDGLSKTFIGNGTFMNSEYFPHLGYNADYELDDNAKRRKHHLPDKPRMNRLEDTVARNNNYVSGDADFVRFHAIVGTDADQTAFTSGNLVRSWQENGRNCFEFHCPHPVLYFLAFVSGRYEKATADWNGVQIEVYHDFKHDFNTQSMLAAAKATLEYCSAHYRPYPDKVLRIVEVPYVWFAQSFPTTIPFSENVGFVAKVDPRNPEDVDYPYYITAHEIAHQWWAHTVIGANVQGSTLFSEALAEYTALMVMKQKYGRDRMRRFLTYKNDEYLNGRSMEKREEQPLYRNENQQYLNYDKGSLAMFALQDDIGESRVDSALAAFCNAHAYQAHPYPVSTDLIECFAKVVPDSLAHLIPDLFTNITLFDNRVVSVDSHLDPATKTYSTTVVYSTAKVHCDGCGKETPVPVDDNLEIALYAKDNEHPLASTVVGVTGGPGSVVLISSAKPSHVVLDPMFKLLDKKPLDNEKDIE